MALPRWTLLILSLFAYGNLLAGEITVFAAASLTDALKEIAAGYEKTSGEKLVFNFAASNTLSQQIQAGAPADIFFSADEAKMDTLATAGLIVKDTRKDLLGNTLVVITPEKGLKISEAGDLKNTAIKHFSIGAPKAVPAGVYAKAWLEKVGLWSSLEPKIVPAENVRAAMAVVESGNAEAGIVYKTDASQSRKVRIALVIPATEGPKIIYPAAVVSDSRNKEAARSFLSYLADKQADETFAKFGFSVIE